MIRLPTLSMNEALLGVADVCLVHVFLH